MEINASAPVAVTGATGYVAGPLVKLLLEKGHEVHATVRDPSNSKKLKYLNELASQSKGSIKYFQADLLKKGSFDEATDQCELVFHTASPFSLNIKDPKKDLLDPAVEGTENLLSSVNKSKKTKRVVLTSSVASVLGDAVECEGRDSTNETHWNETSSLSHQPYSYSKVMAEKAAWKVNEKQDRWDMVTINPSLVLGPGINPHGTSESFKIVKQLADGTYKLGAPEFYIGVVDVRDVAQAHYKAGFTPEASGRFITSSENTSMFDLGQALRDEYGDKYPFPKSISPKFLIWALAPLFGYKRKMMARNVGYKWNVDNSKSKNILGMKYTTGSQSIVDFFEQMLEYGLIEKK